MHLAHLSQMLHRASLSQKLPALRSNSKTEFQRLKNSEHHSRQTSLEGSNKTARRRTSTPKGYLPVYVGEEGKRYLIKAKHLSNPLILELLERSAEEYGYSQNGALRIECDEEVWEGILASAESSGRARVLSCYTSESLEDLLVCQV